MSLHLIYGSASPEEANNLVKNMTERAAALPEEKFFAIVPEQASLNMQKSVTQLHERHATFNIDVVSFNRLAHVVFADLGMAAENVLDDTGKMLVLAQILENCQEDLTVYHSKALMTGFTEKVKSTITELKQYGIDDNDLFLMQQSAQEKGNHLLYQKLQDIRLLYRNFQEAIEERYQVAEELLVRFAEVVHQSDRMAGSHIYLEGFTGFTPIQYRLIRQFLCYAADVTVRLVLPEGKIREDCPEYDLYYLSNQTRSKLLELAGQTGTPVEEVQSQAVAPEALVCKVYAASDLHAEVTFAAKEILRLVRDEGLRYRDIAVIASDLESYHTLIDNIFSEAQIPCFIDHKASIVEHPLPRLLITALDIVEKRASYESIFAYLKNALIDLPQDDIAYMENYCLEFGLQGIRAWSSEMERNRKLRGVHPTSEECEKNPYAGMAWDLNRINQIRQAVLQNIGEFYCARSQGEHTTQEYVQIVKRLLSQNRIEQKLTQMAADFGKTGHFREQKEYEQMYSRVEELLDKIALLSGTACMDITAFRHMTENALTEIRVGIIPPTVDMLTVGDLTRTRLSDVKIVFLLGVNDGKIPSGAASSGMFTERDRAFLKQAQFEVAPAEAENIYTQRFYLYLLMHRPSSVLYLTYAAADGAGNALEPSYIFDDLESLYPGIQTEQVENVPDIKWERQALRELAFTIRNKPDENLLAYFAQADPQLISKLLAAAFFTNQQTPLDADVARDLYGDVLSGSVSRFEQYSICPFKQFLTYGIRLEKRPEYQVGAADLGTVYHGALEKYANKLKEKGYSFRDVPDDVSRQIAKDCVKDAVSEMQSDVLGSTTRNDFLVKRITEVTVKTTDVLRSHVCAGRFDPADFELFFGEELQNGVQFSGKIDRVDIYDRGDLFVKVIDYKSGNKKFDITEIYEGVQLQLAVYLKAAVQKYETDNPDKQVRPAGLYYYLINDHFSKDEEEALERFRMNGVTSCEDGVIEAIDGNLAQKDKSLIIDVSYTKGHELKGKIANETELRALMDFADQKLQTIGEEIREGHIEVHPYKSPYEQSNTCSYCDFRDVCKFEAGSFGTDWKEKSTLDKKEMEDEIYGRVLPE